MAVDEDFLTLTLLFIKRTASSDIRGGIVIYEDRSFSRKVFSKNFFSTSQFPLVWSPEKSTTSSASKHRAYSRLWSFKKITSLFFG